MIVLHVGLRKAGSTTIQNFLSSNEEGLRQLSIEYPRIGRMKRPDHNNLANEIRGHRNFDPHFGTLDDLAKYWKASSCETLLISGESFEECTTKQALRLREKIDRGGDEFRIILILRDLLDLTISSYGQKIKFGNNRYNFDTFFAERFQQRRVNYARTAKLWADAFGWDSMRIRILDRRHLVNGDLLDDFVTAVGLDINSEGVRELSRSGPVNQSPGWRVVEAIRALYMGTSGLPADHPLADCRRFSDRQRKALGANAMDLGRDLGWNKDRGNYLTQEQAEMCLATHNASIRKLNNYLAEPLPPPETLEARGFVGRERLLDAKAVPHNELRDFYDQLGAMPLTPREGVF